MEQLRNIIIGLSVTVVLVLALAASRLVRSTLDLDELVLTKIEPVSLTPPPVPETPVEQQIEELESIAPSPPALDLRPTVDLSGVKIPLTNSHVALNVEVDLFSLDAAPAALPSVVANNSAGEDVKLPVRKLSRVEPSIGLGDLDQSPKLLRLGRFRWPRGLRSNQVKAVVEVELNESGRVRLLRVKSLSDEAIRSVLPSIVNGSRYTAPKRDGHAVKLNFNWPLTLQKP